MIKTNVPHRMPVLWLNGPDGVGKSTVDFVIFRHLSDTGTKTGYVDLYQLREPLSCPIEVLGAGAADTPSPDHPDANGPVPHASKVRSRRRSIFAGSRSIPSPGSVGSASAPSTGR